MDFAETLKTLRASKKLTQQQLADVLFVDKTSICKWESGAYYPNQNILLDIADFFEVSLDALFGRNITENQSEILDLFNSLSPIQQENLLNYARGMAVSNQLDKKEQINKKRA